MSWPDTISLNQWALLGTIPLLCLLLIYTWRNRDAPAAVPILAFLIARGVWAGFRLFELWSAGFQTKLLWFTLAQACLPILGAIGISIMIEFIHPGTWLSRRNILLVFTPLAVLSVLVLTGPLHGLVWQRLWLDEFIHSQRTPLTWGFVLYISLLVLSTAFAMIRFGFRWPVFRWSIALLLVGVAFSFAIDGFSAAGLLPRKPFDPTILAFNINMTLYVVAAIGLRRLLDPLPIARQMAIEHLQAGIVVLNPQGQLLFQNTAAGPMLDSSWSILGGDGQGSHNELAVLAEQAALRPTEILVTHNGNVKHFTAQATPLHDPRGWPLGNLLVFHDITDWARARQLLIQQQRALATLEERERIAAELHDDLGQVLGYVKLQTQVVRDLLFWGDTASAEKALAQLGSVAQTAHTDIREFILGARVAAALERGFLPALEKYLEQLKENFGLQTQMQVSPAWEATRIEPDVAGQLLRIVQEALTNARKHSRAQAATVSLAAQDGRAEVTVLDDGQGFHPESLVESDGLSFGLRIMRRRAESIGGELEVQSNPGHGTRVTVRIPVQEHSI